MHILNTNNNFIDVQYIDFLQTKKRMKICSICGNMDFLYV